MDGSRVKVRRRMLSVSYFNEGRKFKCASVGRGGKIAGWSSGMANRLGSFIDNFRSDFRVMMTLTYPSLWPTDGNEVKRHLKAFTERVRRTGYFENASWVWFLEFQERGAPHFHLLCTEFIGMHWVAGAWAEITGGNIQACSRVERLLNSNSAGAYARKYARKSEQKAVPVNFLNVGRMWGCSGRRVDSAGVKRVPTVVADIPKVSPGFIKKIIDSAKKEVRIIETMSGFVCYGHEEEIQETWRYLQDVLKSAARREKVLDGSRQRQSVDSRVLRERQENQKMQFVRLSQQKLTAGRSENATARG